VLDYCARCGPVNARGARLAAGRQRLVAPDGGHASQGIPDVSFEQKCLSFARAPDMV
jgi:hypothetical protein